MNYIFTKMLFEENYKLLVPTPSSNNEDNIKDAISINNNLLKLGFCMSDDCIKAIGKLSTIEIDNFICYLTYLFIDILGTNAGSALIFRANYNKCISDDWYLDQIAHYIICYSTGEVWHPDNSTNNQEANSLYQTLSHQPKLITLGYEADVIESIMDKLNSKVVLSVSKLDYVKEYSKDYPNEFANMITNIDIPVKENLVAIANIIKDIVSIDVLKNLFKDSMDVIRFAAVISNKGNNKNDIALSRIPKFKLSSSQARMIRNLLGNCKDLFIASHMHKNLFKNLGKSISMRKGPKRLVECYDNLCHNIKIDESFRRIVTPGKEVDNVCALLKNTCSHLTFDSCHDPRDYTVNKLQDFAKKYPGVYSRNLLRMIDCCNSKNTELSEELVRCIIGIYATIVVYKIPVKEVFKVFKYFNMQNYITNHYEILSKKSKVFYLENNEKRRYSADIIEYFENTVYTSLIARIKEDHKEFEGKSFYIDTAMGNYKLAENSERASSEGSNLTFGSKFRGNYNSIESLNIIRPFIWWKSEGTTIDNDLSVSFYSDNFNKYATCYYANQVLKSDIQYNTCFAVHSGDFVSADTDEGVAEFIDIDKHAMEAAGYRYAVISLIGFNGIKFKYQKNLKFGFMERAGSLGIVHDSRHEKDKNWNIMDGKTYEPSTVLTNAINPSSDNINTILVVYDVYKDIFTWVDRSIPANYACMNTEDTNFVSGAKVLIKTFETNITPSVWDLFRLYELAFGSSRILSKADIAVIPAEFNYTANENQAVITQYNMSEIMSKYL